ncbi:MAG: hypothetical protein ACOYOK_14865, partial [Pseudobdellovibrionaceae bacterium]
MSLHLCNTKYILFISLLVSTLINQQAMAFDFSLVKSNQIKGCVYERSEPINEGEISDSVYETTRSKAISLQKSDACESAGQWAKLRVLDEKRFLQGDDPEKLIVTLITGGFFLSAIREFDDLSRLPMERHFNPQKINLRSYEKLSYFMIKTLEYLIPEDNICMISVGYATNGQCENGIKGASDLGNMIELFRNDFPNSVFLPNVLKVENRYYQYILNSEYSALKILVRQFDEKDCEKSFFSRDCFVNSTGRLNRMAGVLAKANELLEIFKAISQKGIKNPQFVKIENYVVEIRSRFLDQLKVIRSKNDFDKSQVNPDVFKF